MSIFETIANLFSKAGATISTLCFFNLWLYEEEMPDCLKADIE